MTEQQWLASEDPAAMLRFVYENPDHQNIMCCRSARKLRLFACACCRQVWHLLTGQRSRDAVEVAERFADGGATAGDLTRARSDAREALNDFHDADDPKRYAAFAVRWLTRAEDQTQELVADCESAGMPPDAQAALLREVAGNPFRPVKEWGKYQKCPNGKRITTQHIVSDDRTRCLACGVMRLPRLTPQVLTLARAAYDDRPPDGALDALTLAALADALEEEGCTDAALLTHLRGTEDVPCVSGGVTQAVVRVPLRGPHVRGCWALDAVLGLS